MAHGLMFAKSLSLLLEEVQSAADLTMVRSGLLRVRRFSRSHGLTIRQVDDRLFVDGAMILRTIGGLQRLATAMTAHNIAQITLNAGAAPSELLKLAMMLVRKRNGDEIRTSIFEELRDASLWSVQLLPAAGQRHQERDDAHAADVALTKAPQLKVRLASLAQLIRSAHADGDASCLAVTMALLADVESKVADIAIKAQWTATFTECASADVLEMLVTSLPTCGDDLGFVIDVLKRSGDAGAAVLIRHLNVSESMDVRRTCFDALVELRRGTKQLLRMLEDPQWFVVRNAACLLGAYRSRTSEPELTDALTHSDERVRAAVVTALLQLDTASSRDTVRNAIRDSSAEVRRRAVRGFMAEHNGAPNVDKLLLALERETELDVQIEFLYALGTLATSDAVQKLIRLCATDGRNRPAEFRIAAAEALASARQSAAVPLLRAMLNDSDQHARAAARHLIRAVS
jgi:HEAT repeat protein